LIRVEEQLITKHGHLAIVRGSTPRRTFACMSAHLADDARRNGRGELLLEVCGVTDSEGWKDQVPLGNGSAEVGRQVSGDFRLHGTHMEARTL
jgi:hypothetical protein